MEKDLVEVINNLEIKINESVNLLELAKGYCSANFEKSVEITIMMTLIESLLKQQKEIAFELDTLSLGY